MDEKESEMSADEQQLRQRKIIFSAKEKLGTASKLLRKKIPCTGHLMTPRKLWIQMVPTRECDVVVMFPSSTSDSFLMWLLSRLKCGAPGLIVHVRHHSSSDSYGFYLTAPFKVLLKAAEQYHLPKSLKKEFGGGLKEFVEKDLSCFEGTENKDKFFSTQERQSLVLKLLQNLRANASDVDEKPGGIQLNEGQAIVPKFLTSGVISQVFPLHELPSLEKLQKSWVRAFFEKQPLDDICEYFGVKVAMYFAWLGHYTVALVVPAVVGFLFWIGFCRGDQATEDVLYVLFSVFNVLWTSIYLEAWKRYCATLAYKWGTLDRRNDLLVEPRPFFTGPLEISPVTNRLEPTYPSWKRYVFRYFVTVPIIVTCLAIVFITMIVILQLQDWWDGVIQKRGFPFFLSYFPKILLAIVITFFDEAYYKVAYWLNDMENYRVDSKFENHLIVKVALFQFVNSFLSLFYIAFYLQDQEKLKEQLAALLITRQVIGNIKESALPYLLEQIRLAKLSFDLFGALSPSDAKPFPGEKKPEKEEEKQEKSHAGKGQGNRNIGQAELESTLFKYDGTFEDHLEMFIQMGYVVLFSSAFPMAAFCALVNNLIEIRSDAFKLCFIFQRPFGQRVSDIGCWQNAMEIMGLIAVLVNCALIGLSGQVHRMFPEMSTTQTILLIVALEHIMLIVRYLISYSIPDLPEWVATEMAKVEFARRQAVSLCTNSTVQENTGSVIGRFVVSPSPKKDSEMTREGSVKQEAPPASENSNAKKEPPQPQDCGETKKAAPVFETSIKPPLTPDPATKTKLTHHWPAPEEAGHHLTIGPHSGADWMRRFALDKTRKTSEPEVGSKAGAGGSLSCYRSTECIPKDSSSSDSDLLRSAPPWSRSKFRFNPEREKKPDTLSIPEPAASGKTSNPATPVSTPESSSAGSPAPVRPAAAAAAADPAEIAAKKQRIKRSLMKRARSVAIFSLKLKERRAIEAKAPAEAPKPRETRPAWGTKPEGTVGGELGCLPIEMLISVDDVAKNLQRKQSPST